MLSYTGGTKNIVNGLGVYEAGTTLRCDHDPATLNSSTDALTSLGIGYGAIVQKTLATTGPALPVASIVRLTDASNINNWILGKVVSHDAGSLVVNCYDASGYFAASDWRVIVALGVLVEEQRTNAVPNNSMQGAVVGVVGSGGSMPTGWGGGPTAGISREVTAVGTINGLDYIDLRFFGTATAAGLAFRVDFALPPAAVGQTWTGSVWSQILADDVSQPIVRLTVQERNGSSSPGTGINITGADRLSFRRWAPTRTFEVADTAGVLLILGAQTNIAVGQAFDMTLRIAMPQLELGSFPTSPIRTTGAAATRAQDVIRLDPAKIPYNVNEGLWTSEIKNLGNVPGVSAYIFNCGSGSNRMFQFTSGTNTIPAFQILTTPGPVQQANLTHNPSLQVGQILRLASSYKRNDIASSRDGGNILTDTLAELPTAPPDIWIGSIAASGGSNLNGHHRMLGYLPRNRRDDAELQTKSAL